MAVRICPRSGCSAIRQARDSFIKNDTIHLCDACKEKVIEKYGDWTPLAIAEVAAHYERFGMQHAGVIVKKAMVKPKVLVTTLLQAPIEPPRRNVNGRIKH